jgi:pimeloyl-ACP methyl ester carboxylesterase
MSKPIPESSPDPASVRTLPERLSRHAGSLGRSPGFLIAAAGLVASAAFAHYQQTRVEKQYPPRGRFVEAEGVRLHYVEQGLQEASAPVLVLLHGAGSLAEDFLRCPFTEQAARTHRVIIFDRPGYGYSERPRDRIWGPVTQAELLHGALQKLGVERATILGHSWGTLVAIAMAIEHPRSVSGLVLLGGYYYPTARPDALLSAPPAMPVVGDLLRRTVTPLAMRLAWPGTLRLLFAPAEVPQGFRDMPPWLLLRPRHLRALSEETALIMAAAASLSSRYRELRLPVVIMSGAGDRLLSPTDHSGRLRQELAHADYVELPGVGHMLHHAEPEPILRAISRVEAGSGRGDAGE